MGSVYENAHKWAPGRGATITGLYWNAVGNSLLTEVGASKVELKVNEKVITICP